MTLRNSSAMIFNTFTHQRCQAMRNFSLVSVCIGWFCIGLTLGWPESSLNNFLQSYCNEICQSTTENISGIIQIVINCGSCIGALVPIWIADTYGRKSSFAVAGVLTFAVWASMMSLDLDITALIIVAAVGGIAVGVYVTTAAIYVSEISLPCARGANSLITAICAYSGTLFVSCLLLITHQQIVALIMICLAVFFLSSIHGWMVESPYYLFLQGKTLDAKLALKALRGARTVLEIDPEYRTIEFFFCMTQNNGTRNKVSTTLRKRGRVIIIVIILCMTQMVGAYGMRDYSGQFLNDLVPKYGDVFISLFDVITIGICFVIVQKISQKRILLTISVVGSALGCLVLAIFIIVDNISIPSDPNHKKWVTIFLSTILALYHMIYTLGLAPILPVITGEIFPSRYKTAALCMCISFIYLSAMMIQFTFEALDVKRGKGLAIVCFAIFGSLGLFFLFAFFLPETHGKALYEIQEEFDDYGIIVL